ncbi:MAG TPA: cyclodeaminase/cyclohydrolase family protein [Clostridiales bacterium]|nr:cyclodeaminase/cyclohydrolase family protein [Clostridiales bacterium]
MVKQSSLIDFMDRLASAESVPGGGAAVALTGAEAAGLVAMVAALTSGKKGYEPVWQKMEEILSRARVLQAELLDLMEADAASYQAVVDCFKMPQESEAEKECRRQAIRQATVEAAKVSQKIAETALETFDLAEAAIKFGNRNVVSDGAIAAMLARATIHGALMNVRINAISLNDEALQKEFNELVGRLSVVADQREREVLQVMEKVRF